MSKIERGYDRFTDAFGFIVPLVVQLVMVGLSLFKIAPIFITGIGYIGLGANAVFFAPRAFKKARNVIKKFDKFRFGFNWFLFAIVSIFIGISFALAGTTSQSNVSEIIVTLDNDPLYAELKSDKKAAEDKIPPIQYEFEQSGILETTLAIQARLDNAENEVLRIQREIEKRRDEISSGEATRQARQLLRNTASDDVFYAIPNAIQDGRIIQLIFWAVLMIGTELAIINSIGNKKADEEKLDAASRSTQRIL
jgi:hypothetical protein